MRPPTLASRVPWIAGGLLVALLGVLAALQISWLRQVAEAERQRLDAGVRTALAGLTTEVDREVSRAWLAFHRPLPAGEAPAGGVAELRAWWQETAPAPQLVADVRWVGRGTGRLLRPELPGIEVPLGPARRGRRNGEPGRAAGARALLVAFDPGYLAGELLPALVRRHLDPVLGPGLEARVTVRETGEVVFETEPGLDGPFEWRAPLFDLLPPEDLARLAFAAGFLPGARSEPRGEVFGEGRSRSRRLGALAALLDRPAGWVIEVRPAEGSLDAALAQARRGNAVLSSGILLLLGFAAVALAVSARRAQDMARRQLEFTATVSHELRTPLAAIRSLADNLADGIVRDPGQARLYGAQIAHQGERLTEMVELVLALSAQEAGRQPRSRRRVELAPLLHDARKEALAGHPAGRVELDLPEGLPAVVGDPSMLRRALQNLVANALKHGGAPGAPPWAGVRAVSLPGRREVRIEVSDRGPGIPAVERKRLFEPFFRGERARAAQIPGAGLGLHLVRRVAEAHGGRVEVRSTAGQGSTFTLSLPAGEAAEEEA